MKNPERRQASTTETTDDSGEFEVRPELRGEFDNLRWLEEEKTERPATRKPEAARMTASRLKERHAQMEEENRRKADEARAQLAVLRKPKDEAWRRQKKNELGKDIDELRDIMTQRPPSVTDEEWGLFQESCRRVLRDLEQQELRYSQTETPAEDEKIQELEQEVARLESYRFGRSATERETTKTGETKNGELDQRELEAMRKLLAKIDKLGPELLLATTQELNAQKPWLWFLDPKRRIADKYFSPTFAPSDTGKEREEYEKAMKQAYPKELEKFRRACAELNKLRKNAGTIDRYNLEELERAYAEFYAIDTKGKREEIEKKLEELKAKPRGEKRPGGEETPYFPKPE